MRLAVRALGELGPDLVFAPERNVIVSGPRDGVPLGQLVVERRERIEPREMERAVVLDTSHARDGVLDVAGALRDAAGSKSAKKQARAGDLVISRLRPYLRQVAFVHPGALALAPRRPLALSTEFYVLAPRDESIAFLLPFLLGDEAQAVLRDAQEGGHHPRVPRASLFALRVPRDLVRARAKTSAEVQSALGALYRSSSRLRSLLGAR